MYFLTWLGFPFAMYMRALLRTAVRVHYLLSTLICVIDLNMKRASVIQFFFLTNRNYFAWLKSSVVIAVF